MGCITDVGDSRRNANFDTRVSLFSQFSLEEFIEFGVKHTVGHELPALRYSASLCCHDYYEGGAYWEEAQYGCRRRCRIRKVVKVY